LAAISLLSTEEGFSLPAQRDACVQHVRDQGWTVIDEEVALRLLLSGDPQVHDTAKGSRRCWAQILSVISVHAARLPFRGRR
jgi:hypothetical protein